MESMAMALMPPPDEHSFNLFLKLSAASGDVVSHLQFIRLTERMRRAVAIEYGIPLHTLRPSQAFVSRITQETDPSIYTQTHVDESSTAAFHYSAVLYLSEASAYSGGSLNFGRDEKDPYAMRVRPHAGLLALFSSGWENPHAVGRLVAGSRFALVAFFTTQPCAPPPFGQDSESARAEALWRLGLMPGSLDDFLLFMHHWPHFFRN